MSNLENISNQSLDRAYKLIMVLAGTNVPMGIMEISKALGVTRTTTYAITNSLLTQHFLERNPATKKYTLGYRFYEIGSRYNYQFPFLSVAEKYVNMMFDKWHIRINVSVIKPEAVWIILLTKDDPDQLLPRMPRGYVVSANATSGGKLLMAYQPIEVIDSWFKMVNFTQYMPATITDKDQLRKEFALIRKQGYATEKEELSLHRECISAPIRDMTGEVIAAVSFAGNTEQMQKNFQALLENIIMLGNEISEAIGYNPLMQNHY